MCCSCSSSFRGMAVKRQCANYFRLSPIRFVFSTFCFCKHPRQSSKLDLGTLPSQICWENSREYDDIRRPSDA